MRRFNFQLIYDNWKSTYDLVKEVYGGCTINSLWVYKGTCNWEDSPHSTPNKNNWKSVSQAEILSVFPSFLGGATRSGYKENHPIW